jgi:hypothetical protein
MADRKPFLLRVDPAVLEALQRWAADDLRSLNGQIEYVLREALSRAGRFKAAGAAAPGHEDERSDRAEPVEPSVELSRRRRGKSS